MSEKNILKAKLQHFCGNWVFLLIKLKRERGRDREGEDSKFHNYFPPHLSIVIYSFLIKSTCRLLSSSIFLSYVHFIQKKFSLNVPEQVVCSTILISTIHFNLVRLDFGFYSTNRKTFVSDFCRLGQVRFGYVLG